MITDTAKTSKVSPVFAAELELATKAIESMDKSFLGRIL
jgi:hypothetical protein